MKSSGNCGTGFAAEIEEPRSTISRWRVGPNEVPLNSARVHAAGETRRVTAVVELPPHPEAHPVPTGRDSQGGGSATVTRKAQR